MALSEDEIAQLKAFKETQQSGRGYVEGDLADHDDMVAYMPGEVVLRASHSSSDHVYHVPTPEGDMSICDRATETRSWRTVPLSRADFDDWDWCQKCQRKVAQLSDL